MDVAALDLDRTLEGGQDHDGGAVLVVVHDRAVQGLDDALFDLEAARRGDVLQVDRPEARAQPDQGFDDLVGVLGVEDQRDRVQAREVLEQRGLALHHGQRGAGADVPEAEYRGAVGDDDHQAAGPGVPVGEGFVGGDGAGDLRDAGRVGDGQGALRIEGGRGLDRELAPDVAGEDLLVGQLDLLRYVVGSDTMDTMTLLLSPGSLGAGLLGSNP